MKFAGKHKTERDRMMMLSERSRSQNYLDWNDGLKVTGRNLCTYGKDKLS